MTGSQLVIFVVFSLQYKHSDMQSSKWTLISFASWRSYYNPPHLPPSPPPSLAFPPPSLIRAMEMLLMNWKSTPLTHNYCSQQAKVGEITKAAFLLSPFHSATTPFHKSCSLHSILLHFIFWPLVLRSRPEAVEPEDQCVCCHIWWCRGSPRRSTQCCKYCYPGPQAPPTFLLPMLPYYKQQEGGWGLATSLN